MAFAMPGTRRRLECRAISSLGDFRSALKLAVEDFTGCVKFAGPVGRNSFAEHDFCNEKERSKDSSDTDVWE
jgi:hypothetical protein